MKIKENFFLKDYFDLYKSLINSHNVIKKIIKLKKIFINIKKKKAKIIIIGNGGSAAIASHVSVDLTKVAKIRCVNFNEPDLITCFANDYGYENWVRKALGHYCDKKDILILISSSGKSKNLLNAAHYAKKNKIKIITFTGFKINNPLKKLGILNFWVNSRSYNVIENIHQIWLLMTCDLIYGKREYKASE